MIARCYKKNGSIRPIVNCDHRDRREQREKSTNYIYRLKRLASRNLLAMAFRDIGLRCGSIESLENGSTPYAM